MHRGGTKGLLSGARGSFPPLVNMVVMVPVGSWSLIKVATTFHVDTNIRFTQFLAAKKAMI